jgi:hypothetical protein
VYPQPPALVTPLERVDSALHERWAEREAAILADETERAFALTKELHRLIDLRLVLMHGSQSLFWDPMKGGARDRTPADGVHQ